MKDPRQDLLRQMAVLRNQIDPRVLERARSAVAQKGARKETSVPYDRESALAAVKFFLATKQDGGRFRQKLMSALKAEGSAVSSPASSSGSALNGTVAARPAAAKLGAPAPVKPPLGGPVGWLLRRF